MSEKKSFMEEMSGFFGMIAFCWITCGIGIYGSTGNLGAAIVFPTVIGAVGFGVLAMATIGNKQ